VTPPTIGAPTLSPREPTSDSDVTVTITVSDADSGVDQVVLGYHDDTHGANTTMTLSGTAYEATIPAAPHDTRVWYKVYAWDAAGNGAVSSTHSYRVIDVSPPQMTPPSWQPSEPTAADPVAIQVAVHDDTVSVASVVVYYSTDDGASWASTVMAASSDDAYHAVIGPFDAEQKIQFYVEAHNTAGRNATSDILRFTVHAALTPYLYASGMVAAVALPVAFALIWRRVNGRVPSGLRARITSYTVQRSGTVHVIPPQYRGQLARGSDE
jgi:hypothetical protein